MYFGSLMEGTKAALSQGVCLGVTVDDSQIGRQVSRPMGSEEALRLFGKTVWPDSEHEPDTLDQADVALIVEAGRSF